MNLKRQLIWAAFMMMSVPVLAQPADVVAVGNPDDFLGQTYMLPADPISVDAPAAMPNVAPVLDNSDILTEIFGQKAIKLNANQPVPVPESVRNFTPTPGLYYPKKAVLTKLPDLPPPQITYEKYVDTTRVPVIHQPEYADQLLQSVQQGKTPYFSVPREVRIKFFPGQSALSAQALKWVKAFALKVRDDPRLVVEIRVSDDNWPLQSKRVGLLLHAVLEQGVSRHQIFIYRSARPTDTILLGYGKMVDKEIGYGKKTQKTISW